MKGTNPERVGVSLTDQLGMTCFSFLGEARDMTGYQNTIFNCHQNRFSTIGAPNVCRITRVTSRRPSLWYELIGPIRMSLFQNGGMVMSIRIPASGVD